MSTRGNSSGNRPAPFNSKSVISTRTLGGIPRHQIQN